MVVLHRRNGALRPGGFDARQRHTTRMRDGRTNPLASTALKAGCA
jgi:hypothetical protein